MTESADTRTEIIETINKIIEDGENISISAVAHRCGVSHSLIFNRYPDLKERIKELKAEQKARKKVRDDESLISSLLVKNKALQNKVKVNARGQAEENFKAILVHVHQLYSMYDQLLEDRNKLALRQADWR